jgi:hypothetical protein
MTAYRTSTIKRARRSREAVDQLDRQILDVIAADHPQSTRHLFYRMTDPRLAEPVEKSDRGYRHVQHRVVQLRRSGRLPYRWITDATRRGYFTPTYASAADFIRSVAGLYRADLWQRSRWHVEVWTESRSIAGVIQGDCEALAVSLYPAGGLASISLAFQAAEYINDSARGRRVCVLYIGDYDPAGVLIDVALERELRTHLNPGIQFWFHRLGITEAQIEQHDLPTKPRKPGDRRSAHVASTVEAEAMPASILRSMLREHIEAFLPRGALAAAMAAEESERELLDGLAGLAERRAN